jgi:hypothetical protein
VLILVDRFNSAIFVDPEAIPESYGAWVGKKPSPLEAVTGGTKVQQVSVFARKI